jgi:hypothetical protein
MNLYGGHDFMNLQAVDKGALVTGASAGTDVAIAGVLSAIPSAKAGPTPSKGQGLTFGSTQKHRSQHNDRSTSKDCRSGR